MTPTPACLLVFGLDASAGQREVRRAYASRLKAIDHEQNADAFHALRADYEAALHWVAARERAEQVDAQVHLQADVQADVQADPSASSLDPPASAMETTIAGGPPHASHADHASADHDEGQDAPVIPPHVLAELLAELEETDERSEKSAVDDDVTLVLDEFTARLPTLSGEAVPAALAAAAHDPRLISLAHGSRFERRIAWLLADGWQPGHQHLLPAAASLFEWNGDFRRIELLGTTGHWIQAALLQGEEMARKPRQVVQDYEQLLGQLRKPTDPPRKLLVEDMSKLRVLLAHFPQWLEASTSRRTVERWLELFEVLPEATRKAIGKAIPESPPEDADGWSGAGHLIGGLLALLMILAKAWELLS